MKSTIVRASVLAIAFVGFAASSVVSYSQKSPNHMVSTKTNVMPIPMCLPNDPSCCGMH